MGPDRQRQPPRAAGIGIRWYWRSCRTERSERRTKVGCAVDSVRKGHGKWFDGRVGLRKDHRHGGGRKSVGHSRASGGGAADAVFTRASVLAAVIAGCVPGGVIRKFTALDMRAGRNLMSVHRKVARRQWIDAAGSAIGEQHGKRQQADNRPRQHPKRSTTCVDHLLDHPYHPGCRQPGVHRLATVKWKRFPASATARPNRGHPLTGVGCSNRFIGPHLALSRSREP